MRLRPLRMRLEGRCPFLPKPTDIRPHHLHHSIRHHIRHALIRSASAPSRLAIATYLVALCNQRPGCPGPTAVWPPALPRFHVITLDNDPEMIKSAGRFGFKVYYGDGLRLDVLRAAISGADVPLRYVSMTDWQPAGLSNWRGQNFPA